MKIAIFYNISFSGAKRVVMEHVRGLRAIGNYVDIYTTDTKSDIFDPGIYANKKFIYDLSSREINLPILRRLKKDYYDTFFSLKFKHKKIAKDIDKNKYDIVLVHTDITTQAPFLLRYIKTKNFYYCLEPLRNAYEYSLRVNNNLKILNKLYENLNRWIRKWIDRVNTLSADNIITLSLFGRERIIAAYDLYPKISYLGVDEKEFIPKKVKKKNYILFVADKHPLYGYDIAEKVINLLPKNIKSKFKIISWTKENSERISDRELVNIYNESLVTLSLSKFDTFGLVPLESMACGIPVIAFNVAGYRETVISNKTGYLVDFDPSEIAEKITYLFNQPAEADIMGKNGRKWIEERWTWKKQIEQLNNILCDDQDSKS